MIALFCRYLLLQTKPKYGKKFPAPEVQEVKPRETLPYFTRITRDSSVKEGRFASEYESDKIIIEILPKSESNNYRTFDKDQNLHHSVRPGISSLRRALPLENIKVYGKLLKGHQG